MKKDKNHLRQVLEQELQEIYTYHTQSIDLGLERVYRLLNDLGNPHEALPPVIHIAGTNGKGSTLSFIQAIMEDAGYCVHKYTSPHLIRFNERIILSGQEISDETLLPLIQHVKSVNKNQPITFFEFTMAMVFYAFAQNPADIVLLETGLGGRLDASNVITKPSASLISKIGMDHMHFLGDTIEQIAFEKAGIIKQNCPCFVSKQVSENVYNVFEKYAGEKQAPLKRYGVDWSVHPKESGFEVTFDQEQVHLPNPSLLGEHQYENASLAIACLKNLQGFDITNQNIKNGIQKAQWPARMQHIACGYLTNFISKEAEIWLDGGHNIDGTIAIAEILKNWQEEGAKTHLIFATVDNRDPATIIAPLLPFVDTVSSIDFDHNKARRASETVSLLKKAGINAAAYATIIDALLVLNKEIISGDRVLICGSLYMAGEILAINQKTGLA